MYVVRLYRLAHWFSRCRVPVLPALIKAFNRIFFGVVLPPSARLGRDVLLNYEGLGTVIHRRAVIGNWVTIGSGVTIGGRSGSEAVPVIERAVMIGSGAKVLGAIRVGEYASIGANAVVVTDVLHYAVAVCVPARVVKLNHAEDMSNYQAFAR